MNLILKPLRIVDSLLNRITMYRLLVYGLGVLAAVAFGLSLTNMIVIKPLDMVEALAILITVSYITNKFIAWAWEAPINSESWLITALILFFIMPPPTSVMRLGGLIIGAIIAMASKFILAYHRKHLFNPAAVAMVIVSWTGLAYSSWWVANKFMLPFTLLLGFLVTRKLHRFTMVFTFGFVALAVMMYHGIRQHTGPFAVIEESVKSWPTIFLGTIMLTEPATLPPFLWQQLAYASIVGLIFASQAQIGPIATTPALALVIGNIYSYMMSPKYKVQMRLKRRLQLSPHIYDFAFVPDRAINFTAGQYAEWTLPHNGTDSRGNRRTFTIASSPLRDEVHIGMKIADGPSSFKQAMLKMQPGDPIMAGQFSGTFVLPRDKSRKLVLIAGGIGITPFLSMLTYMIDAGQMRDVVLFHLVSSPDDVGYDSLLERFSELGIKVVPILSSRDVPADWHGRTGALTPELLANEVPDYAQRTYYLSGPNGMVEHFQDMLYGIDVSPRHVITDYFSGY